MNIWIFNHYAVTPEHPGGTRHYDFARELVRRGHNVTIIASAFHHRSQDTGVVQGRRTWKIEDHNGVKLVWIRTCRYKRNDWRRILGMVLYAVEAVVWRRSIVRENGAVPDVVIGSTPHPFAALAAYVAARRLGSAFLFEVRDLWPETLVRMGLLKEKGLIARAMRQIEKHLARNAGRLILIPPSADEYYRNMGIEETRLVGIPNGVDLELYKNTKEEKKGASFTIIYTGTHGVTNGLDTLLKAAELVQQKAAELVQQTVQLSIQFRLVGEGPERPLLMQMAETLKLRNVEFVNAVPKKQVPQILLDADAVVHLEKGIPGLEKYGSCPNKIFDYLASGKPLIISSSFLPPLPEEVKYAVRVEPDNATQLAEAVIKLSRQPEAELKKMGCHARRVVQQTRSIRVLVDKLEAILDEIPNRKDKI